MAYRILFVDDNSKSMESYRDPFRAAGYEVSSIRSVETALKALDEETYDLIVLDVMMPPFPFQGTKNGLDTGKYLFEAIRKVAPSVPVIIFSNIDDFVDFEKYEGDPNLQALFKAEYRPRQFLSKVDLLLTERNKRVSLQESAVKTDELPEDV